MSQRPTRRNNNYREESSGSNILFTLGLISVVVLLIVGWVMTQGGVNAITGPVQDGLKTITINPTPIPTVPPRIQIGESGKIEQLRAEYEAKISELQEALQRAQEEADKRIEKLKQQYLTQINDLNVRILMLEQDNKRLRGEN